MVADAAHIARWFVIYPSLLLIGIGLWLSGDRFWRALHGEPWLIWWGLLDIHIVAFVWLIADLLHRLPPQLPTWRTWFYIEILFGIILSFSGMLWNIRRHNRGARKPSLDPAT